MRADAAERFWSKVNKTDDGCWTWTGTKNDKGYGAFRPGGGRNMIRAHRFAYELEVGPIPDGLEIDHLCRTRGCVRPSHLEAVTHSENTYRARQDECAKGHPMVMYGGERQCRTCRREYLTAYQRERRARLRAER